MRIHPVSCLVVVLLAWWGGTPTGEVRAEAQEAPVYDVVVYGGTSAGVAAAVQVARQGKTALLIEPGVHLGGLTSGGLGWTDSGNKAVIGGISREFYRMVKEHYDSPDAWRYERPEAYDRYRPDEDAMWTFEPHVAEALFERLVQQPGITVVRRQRLRRPGGAELQDGRIMRVVMESGEVYRGRMFIDATYEGDLLAEAQVRYTVGRESNQQYGETLNGVQKQQNVHSHRFVVPVDPYVTPGDPSSGLLPGVQSEPPGEDGTADLRVQAYCFRMCMSNVPENRVPFEKPENYDPLRFELLLRNFEAGDLRLPLKPDMMPNGKTDTNNNCAFSTDNIGMNYAYPEASYQQREAIVREHLDYQQGLMWTLAHHPRVPESIRKKMSVWGLAKDEFQDTNHWPHQLYVREARRMVADYVVTELDCRRQRIAEDSIGLGSYNMDSHNVQRYVTLDGTVQNEGDVQVSPGGAYLISYRACVPARGECRNLLVPVCLSASHIAYGSIRMEPVFMILGQSTASAAVLAIEQECDVQDVPYDQLRARLLADGQVLDLPANSPPRISLAANRLAGIVVDDADAKLAGPWVVSSSISPYVETGYRHDNNVEKGNLRCEFAAELPQEGVYEVRLAYSAHSNRATNVPVVIHTAEGDQIVRVDQRQTPSQDKVFVSLGSFRFAAGQRPRVTVSNEGTDGFVVVDAVQFLAQ